jgi:hypothetical protein
MTKEHLEACEFLMWCADNCCWRNGSQDLWYSMKLHFDKDKTSKELFEMFLKTKKVIYE